MPQPQRVSQPTRDALASGFAASYGDGASATALCDATAAAQRMPKAMMRAMLRKVTDVGTAAASVIEMAVVQGVTAIADGGADTIPNTVVGLGSSRAYRLVNRLGTVFLTLGDLTVGTLVNCTVAVSGVVRIDQPSILADGSAGVFTQIDVPYALNVPVGGEEVATVVVTPTAAGAWSFAVSVPNNDANENPYNWGVSGVAVAAAPEMDVLVGAVPLADGGADAVAGTTAAVATARTYTINNSGGAVLGLTVPVVAAANLVNCVVALVAQPSATVAAFGTTALDITITPAVAGAWSFTLTIANTDATENPYNWSVSGVAA